MLYTRSCNCFINYEASVKFAIGELERKDKIENYKKIFMHIIGLFNPYEDNKYKDYVRNYRKKYFNQYYSPMANEKKGIKK